MTHDTRTSDDIERDIREERAQMSESINSLQQKFSVDAIVSDIGTMFSAQGSDIGRAVSQTVGRNPAAVALVGVGLAWLFLGQNRGTGTAHDPWGGENGRRRARDRYDPWQDETGPTIRSGNEATHDADQQWIGRDHMARGRKHRARDLGRDGQEGMTGRMQEAAGAVGDAVFDAAARVSTTASDLTERLSHGLDDLSEEARARVLAARRAAHDARQASREAMEQGMQAAGGFFKEQPLVVGALAVALGAALGGVLPHSKLEDDTLGESSDRLFKEAQDLLYAERDKAMAMARTAAADVQDEIRDVGSDLADMLPEGQSVGEVIVDRAASAAGRVIHRATGDIDHQASDKRQTNDKPLG